MKDRNFIIILLLLALVIYLGDKVAYKTSLDVKSKNSVNILQSKIDSFKQANIDLRNYAMDLESICNKYQSSRNAKYRYHLENKLIIE